MGTLNPTITRRPAFTAEIAEKPVTLFCNDEKHGLGKRRIPPKADSLCALCVLGGKL